MHQGNETGGTSPGQSVERPTVETGEVDSTVDLKVRELIADSIDAPVLASMLERQEAPDVADALERLAEDDAVDVLAVMNDQAAADALVEMEFHLAGGILEDLLEEGRQEEIARMLALLAPDDAVTLLRQLEPAEHEVILGCMAPDASRLLRELVGHAPGTAAGMMTTRHVAIPVDVTVDQAVDIVRLSKLHEDLQYLPVIDGDGRLAGLVGLRDLLVRDGTTPLSDIMGCSVKAIRAETDDEDVAREFQRYDYTMLPVVDTEDHLLGIVTVDDVIDLIQSEQTEDAQRSVGAGAGESVYSDLAEKMSGRLPWLLISAMVMIPASFVVLQFDGLIEEVAFLAVLMPMVAALAGNAGHQALAVTLRGISLDEVHGERVVGLLVREVLTGVLSGMALGVLLFCGVWLLSLFIEGADWWLGLVMAVALVISMGIGSLTGAGVPLLLKRLGADPAQGSCIVLIMITDAVAFGSLLGLTWLLMRSIQGA